MTTIVHRPFCDLLGCTYPIVQAGMGGVARSELVAAVTKGGGFGFLGIVREPVTRSDPRWKLCANAQGWVVRKLEALLATIHADLAAMLASHESNIELVTAQLAAIAQRNAS